NSFIAMRRQIRLNKLFATRLSSESHHVISTIHVNGFTGDAGACVRSEKHSGGSDFFYVYIAAQWRPLGVSFEHVAQPRDSTRGESLNRTRGNSIHPDLLLPQITCQVTNGAFERGFRHGHHVVMRNNLFRSEVAHGDNAAAICHEWRGGAGNGNQRIDAYIVRGAKAFATGINKFAAQLGRGSKGHAMHDHVELSIPLFQLREQLLNSFVVGNIAHEAFRARQRKNKILCFHFQAFVLVSNNNIGARFVKPLSDGPSDGSFVCYSKNDGNTAFEAERSEE